MSPALNLRKRRQPPKRIKRWVLELAPSMNQGATLYYNGAKDLSRIYLTNNIHFAAWFESKHHANTCLTSEMKHAGFVAREYLFV